MPLSSDQLERVDRFVAESGFSFRGAVFTDLDGTAVHEFDGRIAIPAPVEMGLKQVYEAGRPVAINSLRFPLSVMRTFGEEWYRIAGAPIPVVSLNGSLVGHVVQAPDRSLAYEELDAFPLLPAELDEILAGVRGLLDAGIDDLLLFYYPRDWKLGEIIWTPRADRLAGVARKYTSASAIQATPFEALREALLARPVCMVFLLIDAPEDRLMAYQHTKRTSFFTHQGVDKLHGARRLARALEVELKDSVGAGDSELDTFLAEVGLAVLVGGQDLEFKGRRETLRVDGSLELGEALFRLARG
jgi:hydroxymethylpyrimidine pyrophosphatase-like HAD family hydrolase